MIELLFVFIVWYIVGLIGALLTWDAKKKDLTAKDFLWILGCAIFGLLTIAWFFLNDKDVTIIKRK